MTHIGLLSGTTLVSVGISAPIPLLSDAGYAFLGVIVSALITTAGAVMVAYITVNARRSARDDPPDDPEKEPSRKKSP